MQLTLMPHINTAVMAISIFRSQSRSLCRLIGMCGFSPVTGEGRRGFFLSVLVLPVLQICAELIRLAVEKIEWSRRSSGR